MAHTVGAIVGVLAIVALLGAVARSLRRPPPPVVNERERDVEHEVERNPVDGTLRVRGLRWPNTDIGRGRGP